jgi:hypothetical protein
VARGLRARAERETDRSLAQLVGVTEEVAEAERPERAEAERPERAEAEPPERAEAERVAPAAEPETRTEAADAGRLRGAARLQVAARARVEVRSRLDAAARLGAGVCFPWRRAPDAITREKARKLRVAAAAQHVSSRQNRTTNRSIPATALLSRARVA